MTATFDVAVESPTRALRHQPPAPAPQPAPAPAATQAPGGATWERSELLDGLSMVGALSSVGLTELLSAPALVAAAAPAGPGGGTPDSADLLRLRQVQRHLRVMHGDFVRAGGALQVSADARHRVEARRPAVQRQPQDAGAPDASGGGGTAVATPPPTPAPAPTAGGSGTPPPAAPPPAATPPSPPPVAPPSPGVTPVTPPTGAPPPGGYQDAPNYSFSGSDEVRAELDKRADPSNADQFEKKLGAVDSLRISSLEYSFNRSGVLYNIGQTLLPTDSFREHWFQATDDNAYKGMDSGWLSFLERLRGVVHLVGDLASTIAGIASVVAIVSGLLALFTSVTVIGGLTFGAIAGIATIVATAAAIVKVIADVLDVLISVIQILILVHRAKTASPGERARIAQLLKKEANDISQNVISIAFQAAAIGAGAAIGGVAEKSAQPLKVWQVFGQLAPREIGQIVRAGAASAARAAELSTLRLAMAKAPDEAAKLKAIMNFPFIADAMHRTAAAALLRSMVLQGINLVPTIGLASAQVRTKVQSGVGGTSPLAGGAGPKGTGGTVSLSHVSAWPAVLGQMSSYRGYVHSAQERMKHQYDLARDDADPAQIAKVDEKFGKIEEHGNRIQAAALANQQQAAAEQAKHQQQADAAKSGVGPKQDAKAQTDKMDATAKDAQAQSPPAPSNPGFFDRIGAYIAKVQKGLNDWILKTALVSAGMNEHDLDLAGIEHSALGDHAADEKNKSDSADAAQTVNPIQGKVNELRAGLSTSQQNAVQGMVDTMLFINALDEMDQNLAGDLAVGTPYVQKAAEAIAHELATKQASGEGSKIDDAYVAPITDGAASFQKALADEPKGLQSQGDEAVAYLVSQIQAAVPGADVTNVSSLGGQVVAGHLKTLQDLCSNDVRLAGELSDQAKALKGTSNYDGARSLAEQLESLYSGFEGDRNEILESLANELIKISDQVRDAIQQSTPAPAPSGPPGPGGAQAPPK